MRAVLLDSGILAHHSDLLGRDLKDWVLIAHADSVAELDRRPSGRGVNEQALKMVAAAVERDALLRDSTDLSYRKPGEKFGVTDDEFLAELALVKKPAYDEVVVATDDAVVARACTSLGVHVIGSAELRQLVRAAPLRDELSVLAMEISRQQRKTVIVAVASVVALFGIGLAVYANLSLILAHVNAALLAVLTLFAGCALYVFRARQRFGYGLLECGIGVFLGYQALDSAVPSLTTPVDWLGTAVRVLAGLYVVVRGLDNIGKSDTKERYFPWWNRFAPPG